MAGCSGFGLSQRTVEQVAVACVVEKTMKLKMGKGVFSFDHPLAKKLGYTEDKFEGWLGLKDGYIYISFIVSKKPNQGNLSKLFDRILELGYGIKVPTPFARMKRICVKHGFKKTIEHSAKMGDVEVWVKEWVKKR